MNEHELDQRIREALHAEPSPGQLARLEAFWQRTSRSQRRRRLAGRAVAVAASVAVLAGAFGWLLHDRDRMDGPIAANQPAAPVAQPQEKPRPAAPTFAETPSALPAASRSAGREPTPYERIMFTVQSRQAEAAESSRLVGAIDAAIAQLAANPAAAAADQFAEASPLQSAETEPMLLQRLSRADPSQTRAIVQLLAECGTRRSTPALLKMARQESLRPAALAALEKIVGLTSLAEVAQQTGDRPVRRAIVQRLLTADSDAALRAYLSLVPNPSTRSDALATADAIPTPPTAALLALLKDQDKQARLSAAMVLGHMNGPQVTAALIAIVTEEPAAPAEAWLALLACRGESADRFLAVASQHPQMLGQVNNARMTWARMVQ